MTRPFLLCGLGLAAAIVYLALTWILQAGLRRVERRANRYIAA